MPAFLVPVISAIGAAVGGTFGATLIMYSTQIAIGAALLGTLALSSSQASKAKRKARNQFNASQVDRLVNVSSTVAPRMLVLGRARVGGHVFFRGSVGANKEKLTMLIALAAHEIDAVESIYLNDVLVARDSNGYVLTAPYMLSRRASGTVLGTVAPPEAIPGTIVVSEVGGEGALLAYTTYQYEVLTPKARIRAYLGAPGQAAAADVIADFPTLWTADHKASGVAYLHCEFWYDETAFPSGLPNVTALVRGAKCFDPRTSTTIWSENPAVLTRHVITHPQFGKRASLTAAEDARIIAAANVCDTAHTYNGGLTTLFRASLVVPFGASARDAIDDLVQSMAGQWAYAAGEFSIKAGVYTAPVLSFTDADLAVVRSDGGSISQQPINISTHRARNEKFNVVTPKIWDAGQGYKQVSVTPLKASALITRDGAELVQDIEMPGVFHAPQALHVAGVAMRDARDPLTVTLPFKLSAYRVELFDNITLTLTRFGWSSKVFNVLRRSWSLDGALELTLKETAAAIYQPDASFEVQGYGLNTSLPTPWDIDPPTVIGVSSGTSELIVQEDGTLVPRVRVQWAAVMDATLVAVELQWQAIPDADWRSVSVPAGETQAFLLGVADGQVIVIRVRSRATLAVSDWAEQIVHTVVGKTEPPPDVADLSINGDTATWSPVDAPDLAGYQLRFQYGDNTWWDTAVPLHTGFITEAPYGLLRRPQGDVTVLIKAIDTTGNLSVNAAAYRYGFSEIVVRNPVVTLDQHPTFPGDITGGTVAAGDLEADDLDEFYEPAMGPMYLPEADPMYGTSQYAELGYEFSVSSTEPGNLVLQYTISAESLLVEYQTSGAEPMYEPDADPMYEPVGEALYGDFGPWAVWPGSLAFDGGVAVGFRLTLSAGLVRGVIYELTALIDAPEISEVLDDVLISALGTRLPLSNTYRVIRSVQLTVQSDGGTGVSARLIDKNAALGPLSEVLNTSGVAVAGRLDAQITGY